MNAARVVARVTAGFSYLPVVDLYTGRVLAHQPRSGRLRTGELGAAAEILRAAVSLPTPLHLPVSAAALLAAPEFPDQLAEAAAASRRDPHTVLVQFTEADCVNDAVGLRRRCAALRQRGFGVAVDGVGAFHGALSVLAALRPQVVKIDRTLIRIADQREEAAAVLESLLLFCRRINATLVASGIEEEGQVEILRSLGVSYGEGPVLGDPTEQWYDVVAVPRVRGTTADTDGAATSASVSATAPSRAPRPEGSGGPTIRDLLRRAMSVRDDASGDEVRELFALDEDLLTIVVIDAEGKVVGTIARGSFMLAASGPYGHALNARRGVAQHANSPRLVSPNTPVTEAITLVTSRSRSRVYDDLVAVDEAGRCIGIVRVADLLTAVQRSQVDAAISLDPLTSLPSGRAVEDQIRHRLRDANGISVSWIDVDRQTVIDEGGFVAGNAVVVEVSAVLRRLAAYVSGGWVGHPGAGGFVLVTDRSAGARAIQSLLDCRPEDNRGRRVDVSIGTVDCPPGMPADPALVSARLAELTREARGAGGTAWVCGMVGTGRTELRYSDRSPAAAVGNAVWLAPTKP